MTIIIEDSKRVPDNLREPYPHPSVAEIRKLSTEPIYLQKSNLQGFCLHLQTVKTIESFYNSKFYWWVKQYSLMWYECVMDR